MTQWWVVNSREGLPSSESKFTLPIHNKKKFWICPCDSQSNHDNYVTHILLVSSFNCIFIMVIGLNGVQFSL